MSNRSSKRKAPSGKTSNFKSGRPTALSRKEQEQREKRRAGRVKLWLIVFAVLAVVSILAAVIIPLVINYNKNRTIDYLNDDLSKYIYISESDYKSFPVEINLDEVRDIDVETALIRKLCEYKSAEAHDKGKVLDDQTVGVGHVVYMRYRGYYIEDGVRVYFDGGTNLADGEITGQEIGSADKHMYPGFEYNLIGKNSKNYGRLMSKSAGTVGAGDIIVLNYSVMYPDGTAKSNVTEVIDLSLADTDKRYGEGFCAFLLGKSIGQGLGSKDFLTEGNDISTVYTEMTVKKTYQPGENPLVIEAYAPKNADSEEIKGKTVYFEVYIDGSQVYDAPAADDGFVKDKLKLTEASLAEYAGESLIDKYKSKLRAELEEQYEGTKRSIIEDAMWEHYSSKVKVKRLPSYEVNRYYAKYLDDLRARYSYAGGDSAYGSFDYFAATTLEAASANDWESALRRLSEQTVTEKLIFYYIIKKEGHLPSESEFRQLYERSVDDHVIAEIENSYNDDSFKTDEEYENMVRQTRDRLVKELGEAYFADNAYFAYGIERLLQYASIAD